MSEENYSMEEYMPKLEEIINLKLNYFKELKQRIQEYKSSQKSNPVWVIVEKGKLKIWFDKILNNI